MLKNKAKDMSRSVLPSTARKRSRDLKRHAHKATRTRVRAALHDWDEDSTDELLDPQRYDSYRGVKVVVSERRDADKVRPLMHWAEAKADDFGATAGERYRALRALLPPGIIGWHAMTHVEYLEPFRRDPGVWWRLRDYDPKAARRNAIARKEKLAVALRDNADLFGALNTYLKRYHYDWVAQEWVKDTKAPRALDGIHDIEAWVDELKWGQIELIENWLNSKGAK